MSDSIDLIAAQEQLVERYAEASPEETQELAHRLAQTMRAVAEDESLWADLRQASERQADPGPLKALALLDWETLLAEWGVEEAELIAFELIDAVSRGRTEPGAWDEVRTLLPQLAERLDGMAAEPSEDRRWLGRMKDRMAAGVSVLRRVKVGSLIARMAKGVVFDAAGPPLLAGAMGGPIGPFVVIAAAAVCAIGAAAWEEIRAAIDRPTDEERSLLAHLFQTPELMPGRAGQISVNLDQITGLIAMARGVVPTERIAELLAELRCWAARVGARLLSARPLIAAHLGAAGLHDLETVLEAARVLNRELRAVATAACEDVAERVRLAADHARRAFDDLADKLQWLDRVLTDAGFGGPGH